MLSIPAEIEQRMRDHLTFLYGSKQGAICFEQLWQILARFVERNPDLHRQGEAPVGRLDQRDAILITYGDQITEAGLSPLKSLGEFLAERLKGVVSGVHILPFFPYSSDDGFSVIDYNAVEPALGAWDDVTLIGRSFRLMFDAVINHISAHSAWFQGFLNEDPAYSDYFIVVEPETDLSMVTRPRALPLLTPVETPSGEKLVWTTFSTDQIDLNFANPHVLLAVAETLLLYVEKGADLIRLDAIAFLWKEIGTSCIHLPQTHSVIQLFRALLDVAAPDVLLVTETNVPHEENISYFGDGTNEAQMVYQFPLAPLVLDAFHSGDAGRLLQWAQGLETPSPATTFFNFTASHDGIGLRPVEGILDGDALQQLVDKAQSHGGFVSFKTNPDGSESPYELNISYFDALSDPGDVGQEGLETQIGRFMTSQAIMLSLAGVPGIYIHSLLGSRSDREGVEQTGRYRTINRQKFRRAELEAELADPASLRHQVFQRYADLLRIRASQRAFHPEGSQRVLSGNRALFALLRTSPECQDHMLCVHNVSNKAQLFQVDLAELGVAHKGTLAEALAGGQVAVSEGGRCELILEAYQFLWLRV